MSIINGQQATAADFVSTSGGASDSGKVAKLDANGLIDKSFIAEPIKTGSGVTAGDAFTGATSPEAAFIGDGTSDTVQSADTSSTNELYTSLPFLVGTKAAQKFVIGGSNIFINRAVASLGIGTGGTADVVATIETNSGGAPSGTAVATSGTVNVSGGQANRSFDFPTVITLTAGVTYWLVLTFSNGTASGTSVWGPNSGGTNEAGTYNGTWNIDANDRLRCNLTLVYTAGLIYKTNTSSPYTNAKQCDGFVINTVAVASTAIQFISAYAGFIIAGFTGLTLGSIYYCNGRGTISTTDPGSAPKVGRAIATTKLFATPSVT